MKRLIKKKVRVYAVVTDAPNFRTRGGVRIVSLFDTRGQARDEAKDLKYYVDGGSWWVQAGTFTPDK